ncbi:MAG TPA: CAP domain-containing protein [Urbifossiella sp.]|jgi:uncharacterized protein YkwD|nr:CAP domain-containing protein [Urbifossiella sp.]
MRGYLICSAALMAASLTPVRAQHVEGHEVEKIEVPHVPDVSGKRPDLDAAAKTIVERTNAFRKTEGRNPVPTDPKLAATASDFAAYMARTDEYGHQAGESGPGERVKRHGYDYALIAENIAMVFNSRGYDTGPLAGHFVSGWEKSPPHRRNMLDPDVTATGVAVARSEKTGHYYAVQLFGRPKSAVVVFRVVNQSGEDVSYAIGDRTFDLPPRLTRTHTLGRPAALTFQWPGGGTTSARSVGSERFLVTKDSSGFAVKKE